MSKAVTVEPIKREPKKKCGIVMPIAGTDGYSGGHWESVKKIIIEAATDAGFESDLVSYSDETSIIHSNIINNLYHNEIVVVDVSSRNPNVMFELGIRLAFDKPTIVIKDEITPYTFDAGVIDHLPYPKGLDYFSILNFKKDLSKKIQATYEKSTKDDYRSFLKNFTDLKITKAKLDEKEVTASEYLLKELKDIKSDLRSIRTVSESNYKQEDVYSMLKRYWEKYRHNSGKLTVPISENDYYLFLSWLRDASPAQDWATYWQSPHTDKEIMNFLNTLEA